MTVIFSDWLLMLNAWSHSLWCDTVSPNQFWCRSHWASKAEIISAWFCQIRCSFRVSQRSWTCFNLRIFNFVGFIWFYICPKYKGSKSQTFQIEFWHLSVSRYSQYVELSSHVGHSNDVAAAWELGDWYGWLMIFGWDGWDGWDGMDDMDLSLGMWQSVT